MKKSTRKLLNIAFAASAASLSIFAVKTALFYSNSMEVTGYSNSNSPSSEATAYVTSEAQTNEETNSEVIDSYFTTSGLSFEQSLTKNSPMSKNYVFENQGNTTDNLQLNINFEIVTSGKWGITLTQMWDGSIDSSPNTDYEDVGNSNNDAAGVTPIQGLNLTVDRDTSSADQGYVQVSFHTGSSANDRNQNAAHIYIRENAVNIVDYKIENTSTAQELDVTATFFSTVNTNETYNTNVDITYSIYTESTLTNAVSGHSNVDYFSGAQGALPTIQDSEDTYSFTIDISDITTAGTYYLAVYTTGDGVDEQAQDGTQDDATLHSANNTKVKDNMGNYVVTGYVTFTMASSQIQNVSMVTQTVTTSVEVTFDFIYGDNETASSSDVEYKIVDSTNTTIINWTDLNPTGGGDWANGSNTATINVSMLGAGTYTLYFRAMGTSGVESEDANDKVTFTISNSEISNVRLDAQTADSAQVTLYYERASQQSPEIQYRIVKDDGTPQDGHGSTVQDWKVINPITGPITGSGTYTFVISLDEIVGSTGTYYIEFRTGDGTVLTNGTFEYTDSVKVNLEASNIQQMSVISSDADSIKFQFYYFQGSQQYPQVQYEVRKVSTGAVVVNWTTLTAEDLGGTTIAGTGWYTVELDTYNWGGAGTYEIDFRTGDGTLNDRGSYDDSDEITYTKGQSTTSNLSVNFQTGNPDELVVSYDYVKNNGSDIVEYQILNATTQTVVVDWTETPIQEVDGRNTFTIDVSNDTLFPIGTQFVLVLRTGYGSPNYGGDSNYDVATFNREGAEILDVRVTQIDSTSMTTEFDYVENTGSVDGVDFQISGTGYSTGWLDVEDYGVAIAGDGTYTLNIDWADLGITPSGTDNNTIEFRTTTDSTGPDNRTTFKFDLASPTISNVDVTSVDGKTANVSYYYDGKGITTGYVYYRVIDSNNIDNPIVQDWTNTVDVGGAHNATPGTYSFTIDTSSLVSGSYRVELKTGDVLGQNGVVDGNDYDTFTIDSSYIEGVKIIENTTTENDSQQLTIGFTLQEEEGSKQVQYQWKNTFTGRRSLTWITIQDVEAGYNEKTITIPGLAEAGIYEVEFRTGDDSEESSGSFDAEDQVTFVHDISTLKNISVSETSDSFVLEYDLFLNGKGTNDVQYTISLANTTMTENPELEAITPWFQTPFEDVEGTNTVEISKSVLAEYNHPFDENESYAFTLRTGNGNPYEGGSTDDSYMVTINPVLAWRYHFAWILILSVMGTLITIGFTSTFTLSYLNNRKMTNKLKKLNETMLESVVQ